MKSNFCGCCPEHNGLPFVKLDDLKEICRVLDKEGFQIHIHAIGDGAISNALDALEYAQTKNGKREWRAHIAHIHIPNPKDLPRFKELDVTANFQPFWACPEDDQWNVVLPNIGKERWAWQYPIQSIVKTGARLAFGSDWYSIMGRS